MKTPQEYIDFHNSDAAEARIRALEWENACLRTEIAELHEQVARNDTARRWIDNMKHAGKGASR